MTRVHHAGRRAGVLLPLFSMPSTTSWGIGEIGDLATMTAWLRDAGMGVLQLLPTNEMAPGQTSPGAGCVGASGSSVGSGWASGSSWSGLSTCLARRAASPSAAGSRSACRT